MNAALRPRVLLPHRALNLWVAHGGPRAGFLAHTLPMEQLHDADLASQHAHAQRERGAHHPAVLPDLLAGEPNTPVSRPHPAPASYTDVDDMDVSDDLDVAADVATSTEP